MAAFSDLDAPQRMKIWSPYVSRYRCLTRSFVVVRRSSSTERFADDGASGVFITESERFRKNKVLSSDVCEERSVSIASHDEQGRTPVERVFESE
ncbi:MAG: hypothetical protein M3Y84_02930 [Acidobacteriota bacterium]|nr:hypothetical protein [Acidobacteriota bacterium]